MSNYFDKLDEEFDKIYPDYSKQITKKATTATELSQCFKMEDDRIKFRQFIHNQIKKAVREYIYNFELHKDNNGDDYERSKNFALKYFGKEEEKDE